MSGLALANLRTIGVVSTKEMLDMGRSGGHICLTNNAREQLGSLPHLKRSPMRQTRQSPSALQKWMCHLRLGEEGCSVKLC